VLRRCAPGRSAGRSAERGPGRADDRGAGDGARARDALLVVDLQNDYCAPEGCFHRLGLIDPARTRAVADAAARLVGAARTAGVCTTFVRTVQDESLHRNVRERNRAEGRADCVQRGAWGAEPFGPHPRPGDPVLVKRGYDPFLGTTLERDLHRRGVERLIVVGVFTDMCVDALARSAFQLGFEPVIVRDACLPLERDQDECLGFMQRYYGARVVDAAGAAALLVGSTARAVDEQDQLSTAS
jgi:nicotinamidase-related amidase